DSAVSAIGLLVERLERRQFPCVTRSDHGIALVLQQIVRFDLYRPLPAWRAVHDHHLNVVEYVLRVRPTWLGNTTRQIEVVTEILLTSRIFDSEAKRIHSRISVAMLTRRRVGPNQRDLEWFGVSEHIEKRRVPVLRVETHAARNVPHHK